MCIRDRRFTNRSEIFCICVSTPPEARYLMHTCAIFNFVTNSSLLLRLGYFCCDSDNAALYLLVILQTDNYNEYIIKSYAGSHTPGIATVTNTHFLQDVQI